MNKTLKYYNENASDFVKQTSLVDMGMLHEQFLGYIPRHGRILDAGCGSARDSLAFYQKGYGVVAFDASEEIVSIVRKHCNFQISHASFSSFTTDTIFDGIWACASLLHLPFDEQIENILHLSTMLKNDGVFYLSYKYGSDDKEKGERYFCYLDERRLSEIVENLEGLYIVKQWITTDQRKERNQEKWLNVILRKGVNSSE